MTFKKTFLYAALIACIPLSLELWDRYKPVRSFEVVEDSLRGITRAESDSIWRQIDTVFERSGGIIFTTDSTTAILTERAIDSLYRLDSLLTPIIEHSHIPKK